MSSSEPRQTLSTPVAILAGSIIIGAGLFFGLRGREPTRPDSERPPEREASSASPGPLTSSAAQSQKFAQAPAPTVAPAVTDELKATVTKQAAEALEAQRKNLVKTCWEPSFKTNPEPAKVKYVYNVSFDADGKEIALGISETREMFRSDVAQCLRAQPLTLRIPPPGVIVGVYVTFMLP